jgi:hypothetical protein
MKNIICNLVWALVNYILLAPVLCIAASYNISIEFESLAESNKLLENIKKRTAASGQNVLKLYPNEAVELFLCPPTDITLHVASLQYSNNGPTDNVTLKVDGEAVDSFMSVDELGTGFWNTFREAGLQKGYDLQPGRHSLGLEARSTGDNGIDLDVIVLTVSGPDLTTVQADNMMCPSTSGMSTCYLF